VYAKTLRDLRLVEQGKIGYVYKCLGAAILLLRRAMRMCSEAGSQSAFVARTVFEDLTVELVMEGGDADTNAAAACALIGAYVGYANLPAHWVLGLAHKDWLMAKGHRLAVASGVVKEYLEREDDEAVHGGRGTSSMRKKDASARKRVWDTKQSAEEKEKEKSVKRAKVTEKAKAEAKIVKKPKAKAKEKPVRIEEAEEESEEELAEKKTKAKAKATPETVQKTKQKAKSTKKPEEKPVEKQKAKQKTKRKAKTLSED
jgi:flagellar biosynthesis GTPase FlhF